MSKNLELKEILGYLKRDRGISKAFEARLEKAGFKIRYGKYSYWDNQPYVSIGMSRIWLVTTWSENGTTGIMDRQQNDVIEDIESTLATEYIQAQKNDKKIESFFEKYGRNEYE